MLALHHPPMSLIHKIIFIATSLILAVSALPAGTILIEGSDTLGAKLIPQLAEAFKAGMQTRGIEVTFEISAEGSSTGIASLIDGKAEIGMSSRKANQMELAKARSRGVALTPIQIATDGIAIIVNEANPLRGITLRQVESIFTGNITDWAALCDRPGTLSAYTRNTASGTYKAFQQLAMSSRDYGTDTLKMAGNERIAEEVARNPGSIGYVGLAYIYRRGIKILPVDGHMPAEHSYPVARPLYLYINKNQPLRPLLNDFIGFVLSPQGQAIVSRVHHIPLY